MNKYWGFGLNIATELEFPELLPAAFENADVHISLGAVPEALQHPVVDKNPFSSLTDHEYLLNIKNVCRYYAGFGTTVIAEPAPGIDEHSIRLFLLGTVMAAILYQRRSIPFHASAIVKDGSLALFSGASGAGKSTLLASLGKRGYTVFTDDICVLQLKEDKIVGTAAYPMMKLWIDSITHLSDSKFDLDYKVRPQLPKYGQFFYDTFSKAEIPVGKLFILALDHNAENISTTPTAAAQTFRELEKQAYRYKLMVSTPVRKRFFELASHIANTVPVAKVVRPAGSSFIEILADKIESML